MSVYLLKGQINDDEPKIVAVSETHENVDNSKIVHSLLSSWFAPKNIKVNPSEDMSIDVINFDFPTYIIGEQNDTSVTGLKADDLTRLFADRPLLADIGLVINSTTTLKITKLTSAEVTKKLDEISNDHMVPSFSDEYNPNVANSFDGFGLVKEFASNSSISLENNGYEQSIVSQNSIIFRSLVSIKINTPTFEMIEPIMPD